MYSQNNEEQFILKYFHSKPKGTFLDIGANDGITLSNSHALALNGWSGLLFEPSKTASNKANELYKDNLSVKVYQIAVTDFNGESTMHESGTHLNQGDTSLLSTLQLMETKRWVNETFTPVQVETWDFKTLMKKSRTNVFNFITIDAEGYDYIILEQIDLTAVGCEMICIEHNGVEIDKYIAYCAGYGMKEVMRNAENLIMAL